MILQWLTHLQLLSLPRRQGSGAESSNPLITGVSPTDNHLPSLGDQGLTTVTH